ncbi:MAG TPA: glycosyltransferase [Candidatus Peregrinibacteria bacterium]|nr:glycosyltransferase [Candidatus Peregrinibacteria bacterium]
MNKKISVIIPTYNRKRTLMACLRALNKQDFKKKDFEVLIIDDGGEGDASEAIKKVEKEVEYELRFFERKHEGRAAVRNFGVKKAQGEIVIFIGDDIVISPFFLSTHFDFHRKSKKKNVALVGYTTWHPQLRVDSFVHWLENGGPLLDFRGLRDGKKTDFWHFYTGNLSCKREIFLEEKFDLSLSSYGWEDIELGYRLTRKKNLEIYFSKKAIAYHWHQYNRSDFKNYARVIGSSAYSFQKKAPRLLVLPRGIKKIIFNFLALISPILKPLKKEWYWYALFKKYFLEGIRGKASDSLLKE